MAALRWAVFRDGQLRRLSAVAISYAADSLPTEDEYILELPMGNEILMELSCGVENHVEHRGQSKEIRLGMRLRFLVFN